MFGIVFGFIQVKASPTDTQYLRFVLNPNMEGHYISYHTSENSEEVLRVYPTKMSRVYTLTIPESKNEHIGLEYSHSDVFIRLTPRGCDLDIGAVPVLLRPHHISHIKIMPVGKTVRTRVTVANIDWQKRLIHCFFPNLKVEDVYLGHVLRPMSNLDESIDIYTDNGPPSIESEQEEG